MTGSSLLRRLEGALQSPATGGQAAVLVLQIDQLNAATDMALAVRIGRLFASVGSAEGFDVFRMRPWRYAIVVPGGTLRHARALAQRLRLAVRQLDGASCTASVGIALAPAHGSTAGELVDAAEHAMNLVAADGGDAEDVASQPGRSRVVEADIYRKIEALRTLAGLADQVCHGGLAHSHAVAQRATRIAVAMDLDRQTVLAVQLAGELHEIGSLFVGGGEEEDRPNAVRVLLASRLIRMAGLHTASEAVAAMHERIDGSGVPGHEQGDAIPIGARILAVANAIETVLDGLGRGDRGLDSAIGHVRDQAGTSFDRKVAAIALAHARDARNQAEHPPLDGVTVQQRAATLAA
jgi:GGDEF domain-containing protein